MRAIQRERERRAVRLRDRIEQRDRVVGERGGFARAIAERDGTARAVERTLFDETESVLNAPHGARARVLEIQRTRLVRDPHHVAGCFADRHQLVADMAVGDGRSVLERDAGRA